MKTFWVLLGLLFSPYALALPEQNISITKQSEVTATTVSASALAANPNRHYLLIQNKGTTVIYLKYDSAHTGTEGIQIIAGGNYEPYKVPTNQIFLKSDTSTVLTAIFEGQ